MLDPILTIILNLVSSIFYGFLKNYKENKLEYLKFFRGKHKYYFKQLSILKEMPFIYSDHRDFVLDDFVEIELQKVESNNFKKDNRIGIKDYKIALSQRPKVIILGGAGIGKSTFLRYVTLNIIQKEKDFVIPELLDLIPIFVQLKSIENVSPSPILNYVIDNVEIFSESKHPIQMFEKYLKTRKVLLLLDGYDEIGSTESNNYLRSELGLLISANCTKTELRENIQKHRIEDKYFNSYLLFENNYVWLTTRPEYFYMYPVIFRPNIVDDFLRPRGENTIAFFFKGIEELQRIRIIKNIFQKYTSKNSLFLEYLDAENFLNEIDIRNDRKLVEFTKNPLMLTIMCYLYCTEIGNKFENKENFIFENNNLFQICTRVLLTDLDKYKVRKLSFAKRKAYESRRSAFPKEKEEFLSALAFDLMINNIGQFDEEYIANKAISFFRTQSKSKHTAVIVSQINEPKKFRNINFVNQILISGILKRVSYKNGKVYYDFPHQRFRESLAFDRLSIKKEFEILTSNIDKSYLSEFIRFICSFGISTYRDKILDVIEEKIRKLLQNSTAPVQLIALLGSILKRDENDKRKKLLADLFLEIITLTTLRTIDTDFVNNLEINFKKVEKWIDSFKRKKNYDAWNTCLAVQYVIDREELKSSLLGNLKEEIPTSFKSRMIYWYFKVSDSNMEHLQKIVHSYIDDKRELLIAALASRNIEAINHLISLSICTLDNTFLLNILLNCNRHFFNALNQKTFVYDYPYMQLLYECINLKDGDKRRFYGYDNSTGEFGARDPQFLLQMKVLSKRDLEEVKISSVIDCLPAFMKKNDQSQIFYESGGLKTEKFIKIFNDGELKLVGCSIN